MLYFSLPHLSFIFGREEEDRRRGTGSFYTDQKREKTFWMRKMEKKKRQENKLRKHNVGEKAPNNSGKKYKVQTRNTDKKKKE